MSANYQDTLKINSWPEHLEEIVKQCKTLNINARSYIAKYVISYILLWNETASKSTQIERPRDLPYVVRQIEFKILPVEYVWEREYQDNMNFYIITDKSDDEDLFIFK